ncbi:Bifunctional inhibitor/plant lipid transfer protein/seed storage helical domain [Dillenia turbinata]|uniref:Bifunctional inhibitor/plant lipid transfer protein/seed storage helical domain n=1 Tax=Dillenia turbinata TaxID=194707 RepID=A0AAN8WEB1_9MAGN
MAGNKKLIMLYLLVATLAMVASGTMEQDEQDCADQLTNLAACIPFVSGTAKKPTQECCDDTQKVKSSKPKCLCVLIKESSDPSMGLPINTTLALQMPAACNIDAKVSDCPSILNLPPGSPDAKIFAQAAPDSSTTSSTDSPSTSAATSTGSSSSSSASTMSPSTSGSSSDTKATPDSNNGGKLKSLESRSFLLMMMSFIAWMLL